MQQRVKAGRAAVADAAVTAAVRPAAGCAAPGGDADPTLAYLTLWGQWQRRGGAGAQGWGCATAEGRLRRDGTLARGSGRAPVLDNDPLAERLDRIVARLGDDDARWPMMMRLYYGHEEATHAEVAAGLAREFGGRVTGERVRVWMREATASVRGALREAGLV